MKCILILWLAILVHQSFGATVRKCIECQQCELHRSIKQICRLESETSCLKFVGIDINIDAKVPVTHKHCSSPSGCGYYAHNKNFTIASCDICKGNLCNSAEESEHSIFFVAAQILVAMVVNYIC